MPTYTTNYSLTKPASGDSVDFVGLIGGNMDTIDGQMKQNSDDALYSKNKYQQSTAVTLTLNKASAATIQATFDALAKVIGEGETLAIEVTESVALSAVLDISGLEGLGSFTIEGTVINISSIDTGTETITLASNPFAVDDIVFFTGDTIPAGLTNVDPYYVIYSSGNDIRVSATLGGAAVNITSSGSNAKAYVALTRSGFSGKVVNVTNNSINTLTLLNCGIASNYTNNPVVDVDNNRSKSVFNNCLIFNTDGTGTSAAARIRKGELEIKGGTKLSDGAYGIQVDNMGRLAYVGDFFTNVNCTPQIRVEANGYASCDTNASSPGTGIICVNGGFASTPSFLHANSLYMTIASGAAAWAP